MKLLVLVGAAVALFALVPGSGAAPTAAGDWDLWSPLRGGYDQWRVGCTWNQTDATARAKCKHPDGSPGYHGYKAIDFYRNPAMGSGGNVYAARWGYAHIVSNDPRCGGPGLPGKVVRLRHPTSGGSTFYTYYRHLKDITVAEGQWVTENTVIGHVGNTGYTNCWPHLHFEVMTSGGTKQSAQLAGCLGSRGRMYYPYVWGSSTYTDWNKVPYGTRFWSDAATQC